MPEGIDFDIMDEDERALAALGYKQELNRSWSGLLHDLLRRMERWWTSRHCMGLADLRRTDSLDWFVHG